ncbi:sugar phosphate isomerase/epimerase [Rhizobium brockwellii]
MAFKYAFNTWAYSRFPCWVPSYSIEETIRRIAGFGYDGIEIGCAAPHAWPAYLSPSHRRDLKSLMGDLNLKPVSLLPAPGAVQATTWHRFCPKSARRPARAGVRPEPYPHRRLFLPLS